MEPTAMNRLERETGRSSWPAGWPRLSALGVHGNARPGAAFGLVHGAVIPTHDHHPQDEGQAENVVKAIGDAAQKVL